MDNKSVQEKENEIYSRITELKTLLRSWDYKNSKKLDGDYTDEQWAEIVAQRQEWRDEINRLESELDSLDMEDTDNAN